MAEQPRGTLHVDVPAAPPMLEDGAKLQHIVVGSGPSGLLTACLLAKAGKQVAVFDMRERPTEFFGSFPVVLNMRGQAAIKGLGADVLAQFKELGREVEHMQIVPKNRVVAKVPTAGTCIMRDQVVGLLLRVADRLGVPIHWGHKLMDVDLEARTCSFEGNSRTLKVHVGVCVVGADGNYSSVRRVCESKTNLQVQTETWGVQMRYMLAPDPPAESLPEQVDGSSHYVLGADGYVCQQPDGRWSMSMSAIPGVSKPFLLSEEATPENLAALRKLCEENATPFAEHLLTSDEIYKSFYSCRPFKGLIVKCSTLAPMDWIALIGDAAHAVAPFTGEGINSALESATILGNVLSKGGSCSDFDCERREDAHAVYGIALRNRAIVCGTPKEKCANTLMTIMLGIGKKCCCVKGTIQDYMLGKKAEEGVWRYSELAALDNRQRRCLYPCGMCCYSVCCGCKKAEESEHE